MEKEPLGARFLPGPTVGPSSHDKVFVMVTDDRKMRDDKYYLMTNKQMQWVRATLIADSVYFIVILLIGFYFILRQSGVRNWLSRCWSKTTCDQSLQREDASKTCNGDVAVAEVQRGVVVGDKTGSVCV